MHPGAKGNTTGELIIPAGTIMAFAGQLDQYKLEEMGWIYCNGQAISRKVFSNLFDVIGTYYGTGDGINTFNVPDYRGRFLRAVDDGAGIDPDVDTRTAPSPGGATGPNVGSVQNDAFQNHHHSSNALKDEANHNAVAGTNRHTPSRERASIGDPTKANDDTGTPRLSSETRPVNIYTYYIIKY